MDTFTTLLTSHTDVAFALLLGLAAVISWLAWRSGLPNILLMLGAGMAIGPLGFGLFEPEMIIRSEVLFGWVAISVAIILFEGGLSLRRDEFERGGAPLKRLLSVGIVVTALATALLAHLLLDLSLELSLLVGSVLVVTGPTVVGPLLRQIKPVGRSGTIIKWEGILNDPLGAILAVLVLEVVLSRGSTHAWSSLLPTLMITVLVTGVLGYLFGKATVWLIAREHLPGELHGFATLALCLGLFAACNLIQPESGLLAVTIYGIVLANQHRVSVQHIMRFHENLRTVLIALLFIVLAARFTPAQFAVVDWRMGLFVVALILLVRPAAVLASTWGSSLSWSERGLIAWLAPRGIVAAAVASLFAITLEQHGIKSAHLIEPIIYSVIVGTVLVYGLSGKAVAGLLGLRTKAPGGVLIVGAHGWARSLARALQDAGYPAHLIDRNREAIRAARMADLDADDLSIVDRRLDSNCEIHPGIDLLLALTRSDEINALACLRYSEEFGQHRVFQLAGNGAASDAPQAVEPTTNLSGRPVVADSIRHDDIEAWFGDDARTVVTRLSAQYDFQAYLDDWAKERLPLLVLRRDGGIEVLVASAHPPKAGDRLVAFAPPEPHGKATPAGLPEPAPLPQAVRRSHA